MGHFRTLAAQQTAPWFDYETSGNPCRSPFPCILGWDRLPMKRPGGSQTVTSSIERRAQQSAYGVAN